MDALALETKPELRVTRSLIGNKMWLVAGMDTSLFSGDFRVRGYLDDSFLATQSHWKRMTAAERDALAAEKLADIGPALEAALVAAVVEISEYVTVCAAEGLTPNLRKLRDLWSGGELNLATVEANLEQSLSDLRATKRQRDIAEQIASSVKLADYPEMFPAANRKRKLIAVLGPTNSGKSYFAYQRLATARSGAYLGPLRLLALEAFTRLNDEFGVVASLITGEERRIVQGSRVTASTIEMLDPSIEYEVVAIDEIQMLTDPDRGWAWTQAVVGANAAEVWMMGALSAEPAIRALAQRLGLPLEIRKTERKHPLEIAERALSQNPNTALQQAESGDAFIVFSRRDALNLRDDLLAMKKKSVACIYGALSPEVREREARRFASGEADILVATDAIGMGLNLPIQRVVFTSAQKYDGVERGELSPALLQQIGGRAGRYGHASEAGIVVGLTPAEHKVVERLMKAKQPDLPTSGFMIAPGSDYLERIAEMSGDHRLEALLSLFMLHCDRGDRFFTPYVPDEQMARAQQLDQMGNLSLQLKHIFSMAPMASNNEDIDHAWRSWARLANQGKPVRLNFLPGDPEKASLEDAETTVRLLAAYRWFGYRLPDLFVDYEEAELVLSPWIAAVDEHLKSRRKQGVGGGRKGLPSWYWAPAKAPAVFDPDSLSTDFGQSRRRARLR